MRFLSRPALREWLSRLLREGVRVVAPAQVDGVFLFRPIAKAEEVELDCPGTALSAKEWFFPPSQALFTLERGEGGIILKENPWEGRAVLFGLHPCDALGLHLMDLPFLAPPADGSYAARREGTVLVGLACRQAQPGCFCTSVGTSPQDPTHLDVLLTPVDDGYLVAAANGSGEGVLALARQEERDMAPPPPPSLPPLPTQDLPRLARLLIDHPYWSRLADRCLHCNICAYVCPCCYCFDIRDYSRGGSGERVRSWESCQSSGFTRLAGGYDPRGNKGARMRQRFYHKFLYFPQLFGPLSCSGCGRCVRACPVNIDIREVITDMQRLGAQVVSATEKPG